MAFADLKDVQIYYTVEGEDHLPPLVLSHSLGVNHALWEPQVKAFREQFRLIRYDARGHGRSSVPAGPYSIEQLGGDVVRLLDHLQIEQTNFCGISIGGLIGQWIALHAAKRLHRLVLSNTSARIGSAEAWRARIVAVVESGLAPIIPGTLERWFTEGFRSQHPDSLRAARAMLTAMNLEGYVASCAALRDADYRDTVRYVTSPTLVISGTDDAVTSPAEGLFLAQQIPVSRYVAIPAAHLSNVEASDQFNALVLAFLNQQLP